MANELVPVAERYMALRTPDTGEINAVDVNMGEGYNFSFGELTDVQVPRGGDTDFKLVTSSGLRRLEQIEGILLYKHYPRACYVGPFDPSNPAPPVCSSVDGMHGVGIPGGKCATAPRGTAICSKAKFGNDGTKLIVPECSQKAVWYILLPDQPFPVRLRASATSVNALHTYTTQLAKENVPFFGVVTCLTAHEGTTKNKQRCTRLEAKNVGRVDGEQWGKLHTMHEALKAMVMSAGSPGEDIVVDPDDVE